MCDMHFVIIDPTTPISTDDGHHDDNEHPLAKDPGNNGGGTVIKAHRLTVILCMCIVVIIIFTHRVVLAARSEWFRRALQSGMIEDRDRRLVTNWGLGYMSLLHVLGLLCKILRRACFAHSWNICMANHWDLLT